jgi:hypothetical protein
MPSPKKTTADVPVEVARAALRARMEDKDAREAYVKALEKLSPEARSFGLDEAGLHNYSSAPRPIVPLGERTIAPPATLPPIDWNHWRLMPEVPLWQAVALSVDSNPATLLADPAIVAWGKRTDIALSHVSVGNLDLVTRLVPTLHSPVLLAAFAAWAVVHFTDLPPELVTMATASLDKSSNDTLALATPTATGSASSTVGSVKPWAEENSLLVRCPGDSAATQPLIVGESVSAPKNTSPVQHTAAWKLKTTVSRYSGYRLSLHKFLKSEHAQGKPCPKARDVLDEWARKKPAEIHQVTNNTVKYYDANGSVKEASLRAIQQAIKNLLDE